MKKESGFSKFLVLWSGDFISQIGGGLTSFGLGVYIYNKTGSLCANGAHNFTWISSDAGFVGPRRGSCRYVRQKKADDDRRRLLCSGNSIYPVKYAKG